MNNQEQQNFFDLRTILAVLLVAVTFVGWQYYMQMKYPNLGKKTAPVTTESKTETPAPSVETQATTESISEAKPESARPVDVPETTLTYENPNFSFEILSQGMGVRNFKIPQYKDRKGEVIELAHPTSMLALETRLLGTAEPLPFKIEKISDNHFVGKAQVGGLQITKTMEVIPERYLLNFKVAVSGTENKFIGLTTAMTDRVEKIEGGSFLLPQFERHEFFVETAETDDRVIFSKEDLQESWNRTRIASIGTQYFTQAVIDNSSVMPEAKARVDHKAQEADILLNYSALNSSGEFKLEYSAFIGPKSYTILSEVDQGLARVVDFGFFESIARQILLMLKWFYGLVGNWGVAIILLTILVRFLVLPFNIYSYKSMKAMQVIQPQMQAIREKYKNDQAKQQQEIMALMREHKVNPLGGCLPVLLQFPIFIALYQVLGNSIELYQAPFGLWIHDLSLKDPYYILPVLMGLTIFIQQKITPNTMDPAQAKIMMMMPILFTFFMLSLPSGLTLYMFVGAVFSVLQQLYFMRDSKPLLKPRG